MKKAEADKIAQEIFADCAEKIDAAYERLRAQGWQPMGLDGPGHPEIRAIEAECRRKIQKLAAQIDDPES